jgi:hypothetical protein
VWLLDTTERVHEIEIGSHQQIIGADASTIACGAMPSSRSSSSSPVEQDQATPAIGTSRAPNYIIVIVANGYRSAHKEYKNLAI